MKTVHELKPQADPEKRAHKSFQEYAEAARKIGIAPLGGSVGFYGNIHDPELVAHQYSNAAMVQLFDVSAVAPGDLKNKILAFQEEVRTILVHNIREAMRAERQRIGSLLESQGHSSAAALIRV